jgi:NADH dehydrogenase
VTLIDRPNFHLFQPLLYHVATGWLSPGEIATPLRGILSRQGEHERFPADEPSNATSLLNKLDYTACTLGHWHFLGFSTGLLRGGQHTSFEPYQYFFAIFHSGD